MSPVARRLLIVLGLIVVPILVSIGSFRYPRTHGPFEMVVHNEGEPLIAVAVTAMVSVPYNHGSRLVYMAKTLVDSGQSVTLPRGYMSYRGADGPPNLLVSVTHPLLVVESRGMTPTKTDAWRTLSLGTFDAKRLKPQGRVPAADAREPEGTQQQNGEYLLRHFRRVRRAYRYVGSVEALARLRPELDVQVGTLIDQFDITDQMRGWVLAEYEAVFEAQEAD